MPVAVTVIVRLPPALIVPDAGWLVIAGAVQAAVTVTVAVALLAAPQAFVTRTQYEVVVLGLTVRLLPVAPPIGFAVLPDAPMYH